MGKKISSRRFEKRLRVDETLRDHLFEESYLAWQKINNRIGPRSPEEQEQEQEEQEEEEEEDFMPN